MLVSDYNQCVDIHADALYRFIAHAMRNRDLAQDVVQEAFTRLWEKRSEVEASKAKSYLFTTGYRCMIDLIRKEKKQADVDMESHAAPSIQNDHGDLNDLLHEALQRLPEMQRSVVLLRDYEGYSYEEIGDICSLSESQVKVYIFRARKTLKEYLVNPAIIL
ncbi:MAG: RNA polymerase sigma factor [Cryomorphaceae bacterium]|nr:MAG: RNA polymerase sigma factor [Cryomorphaceae bacterium]